MTPKHTLLILLTILAQQGLTQSSGFGVYQPDPHVACLSLTQHEAIEEKLATSRKALIAQGWLPKHDPNQRMITLFSWPIEQNNGLDDYGVHGISNFVDQNPATPNQILDYNCGARSYDLSSGYNHGGIDIYLWPFAWYKMDHDQVKVVAAAPGVIIFKDDGNFDRNCGFNNGDWNAVYVQHEDGSVAWYGHLKNESVTTKSVGLSVERGEYLGIVGSSGSSTAPHLHFEIHNAGGELVDPYAGPCNSLNSESWWIEQRPYFDSGINALRTQRSPTDFPACPQTEVPFEQNTFCGGDLAYFVNYLRDQQPGQTVQYTIRRPNGAVWQEWEQFFSDYYSSSWWYWNYSIPVIGHTGTWTFQAVYLENLYERKFDVVGLTIIQADGPTEFCEGGQVTLSAPESEYGFEYQWQKDDEDIPGATSRELLVDATGDYSVVVSATGACATTSSSKFVNVYPQPEFDLWADTIYESFPAVLDAGPGWVSYQWSIGTVTQLILIEDPGCYSVTVTDFNGCSATDFVCVQELPTAVNDHTSSVVRVYPNPVAEYLVIESTMDAMAEVELYDLAGKCVHRQSIAGHQAELNLSMLPKGMYLVRVAGKTTFANFRIIRQ